MTVEDIYTTNEDLERVIQIAREYYRQCGAQPLQIRRVLGVDLGRVQDPSAIAMVEEAEVLAEFDSGPWGRTREKRLSVRHLERLPLGTPYPQVVERLKILLSNFDPSERPEAMVVDATGVGAPVVNLLTDAKLGMRLGPVTITGGSRATYENGYYNVPKRDLITNLQLLLQQKRLRVAAGMAESETLVKEMKQMRVRMTSFGHEQYGAWREGEHDDLVLAVSLAVWWMTLKERL